MILELVGVYASHRFGADAGAVPAPTPEGYSNTHELGTLLYDPGAPLDGYRTTTAAYR